MPKTRRTRKRTAKADTTKAEEAVQKAPREALQMCIDDMELQGKVMYMYSTLK